MQFWSPRQSRRSPRNHPYHKSLQSPTVISPSQVIPSCSTANTSRRNILGDEQKEDYTTWVYWTSPEAERHFGLARPPHEQDKEDITAIVFRRIGKFRAAWEDARAWRKVVEDLDSQDLYTETDVFHLRHRCQYLARALEIAIRDMNKINMCWKKCCKEAMDELNNCDKWKYIKDPQSIIYWHCQFRTNNECFKNKHLASISEDKSRVSKLFDLFPEAKDLLQGFIRANLHGLSTEKVYCELHDNTIPLIAHVRKTELLKLGDLEPNEE
ncbi:unnamed protein product [Cylindrotheca closterium]|uniref:Uncharacterized protein n=1 Tax=Cylindrotheca closterium TaxID=2856 RepID=A0AAD2CMZ1_9STRA|nr:unnamed protein product [Cylindrotheca closterium]